MSKVVKIICPLCNHEESFKTGYDYTDSKYRLFDLKSDTSLLSKIKDKKIKEKVSSFIRHGADLKSGYGYKLYICDVCNKVESLYDFTISSYNNEYSMKHTCSSCKKELKELDTSKMFEYKCQKCRKNSLYYLNK